MPGNSTTVEDILKRLTPVQRLGINIQFLSDLCEQKLNNNEQTRAATIRYQIFLRNVEKNF